ncbi:MAG: DUF1318 domain-containing protein [Candidatus Omnitrophota bacterium]
MRKCLMMLMVLAVVGMSGLAFAAYDIKTMTPQVKEALQTRQQRFNALKQLKVQGVVGENNRGYVEVLKGGADRELVNAENADRRIIYEAIVTQNGLDAGAMATVEAVFAGVQRDKAEPGESVQDVGGRWATK